MTRIQESQRVPIQRPLPPPKETPPPENRDGDRLVLKKATGAAQSGVQRAQSRVSKAKEAYGEAQSGWKEFKQAQKSGDWQGFYSKKLDPLLDRSALGPDDEYQDAGKLGPILTDRLAIGETVALKIEAGATVPLEEFGIPNAKLDAGSTFKLTRVPKVDRSGKPILAPLDERGNSPTELQAVLELGGRAGGSVSAKAGWDAGISAGKYKAGVRAVVGAEAEAGLDGKVSYTFAFDPSSSAEMKLLGDLMKRTASGTAEMALPGIGPLLTSLSLLQQREFTREMGNHLRSVGGEGGLYAQAVGSARASLGIFRTDLPKPIETDTLKEKTQGLVRKLLAELRKGQLAAGVGIESHLGVSADLRTGEKTVYARLSGTAGVNGRLPLYNLVNEGIQGDRTLAFTYDARGQLKEVTISDEVAKEAFAKGLRGNIEDMVGRPFGKGAIAQLAEADAVRIRYHLSPAEWESLNWTDLFAMKKHPGQVEVKTVHRTALELKASVELDLGAQVGLRAQIVGSHEAEKTTP